MSFIDSIKSSVENWTKDRLAGDVADDVMDTSIDYTSNAVTEAEAEAAYDYEPEYTARSSKKNTEKVINMHNPSNKQFQIRLIAPKNYEEVGIEVVSLIKANCAVILNLNALSNDDRSKIIYFMLGVVAMSEGTMRKSATNTFVITPKGVDLVGEIDDRGSMQ